MTKERSQYGLMVMQLRQLNDISLDKMAKRLKVTGSYLAQLERGEKQIPLKMHQKVSKFFNLNVEEKEKLMDAIILSNKRIEISFDGLDIDKELLILRLSKLINKLNDSQVIKIFEILENCK